jgi:acetoacetyl-CoA synthetase
MPSMPIYFWNDPEGKRYHDSYFTKYPGVWQHGDWIQITPQGTAIIYGRSDSTINRHGVRMGSSEIYQAVESLPAVTDSLVIDLEYLGRPSFLPLFVVLAEGKELTADLREQIAEVIRSNVSPRHVPDAIYAIPEVPRTLNGKKLEVPIRKILMGFAPGTSVDPDAMANPKSLDVFLQWAKQWNSPD